MALRMTEEEYAEFQKRRKQTVHVDSVLSGFTPVAVKEKPKRNKYGNHMVEIDGKKFASRHEAETYLMLMQRVADGELKCVLRQVPFDLPGGIKYMADFVTITPDMQIEGVYDAKSEITKKNRTYINKKKQLKACWGVEIKEV